MIHLDRPFSDLPFYMTFPMFAPIPKAKDTKENYQNKPLASGPYKFESFHPGHRAQAGEEHQLGRQLRSGAPRVPGRLGFKWTADDVVTQQQVLNSNGPDAAAINYGNLDASLIPQLTGREAAAAGGPRPVHDRLPDGHSQDPAGSPQGDRQGAPVRHRAQGRGLDLAGRAGRPRRIMSPSVPGWENYEIPGLNGTGKGDEDDAVVAKAKQMLTDAERRSSFELSLVLLERRQDRHPGAARSASRSLRGGRLQGQGDRCSEGQDPHRHR